MVNDIIDEIKKAEEQSKNIIAAANKDGDKIIDDAEVKAKSIRKSIDEKAKTMMEKAQKEAEEKAAKEEAGISKEYEKKLAAVDNAVKKNSKKAKEFIIKRVYE